MKRILFLLVILIFTFSIVTAQDRGQNRSQNRGFNVSGTILDGDTKDAMEQVTVQLLSLPDSAFVKGMVSGQNGRFRIEAPKAGKYVLRLSFVGYQTIEEEVELTASQQSVRLGEIILPSDAIFLGEAVIVAEAPPVTMKEDTIIYAASAYRVAEGAMLEDLVKKLPGAEVDSDGKITINGKEVSKIMVDGKEFFSDDPKVSMKNLPVNIVENVKAYEKKSDRARITGIDDGEEETVLDLTVKKGMKRGWIGNLITGYGTEDRYEAGGMISSFQDDASLSIIGSVNNTNNSGFSEFGDAGQGRGGNNAGSGVTASKSLGVNYAKETKKVQYGGNVQYGYTDNDAWSKSSTERFLGDEGSSYNNSENSSRRKRHDFRADLRLEWKIDSLTTLVFRPNASYSTTNSWNSGISDVQNNARQLVNDKKSSSFSDNNNYSLNGRIEFFRKFNKPGRNMSLGFNGGYSDSKGETFSSSLTNFYEIDDEDLAFIDSVLNIDQTTNRTSQNTNYRVSASYTEPIFKNHFLQLRYNFSYRNSLAESLVYDNLLPESESGYYVDSLSNKVENFYYNHSAEVSLRGVQPKMMYNVGFSVIPQSSESKTTIGPNSYKPTQKQDALNFAPSVMFRYMFSKQHTLQLRYRGQSSEPDISNLQEVIDISDPLNLQYGNPDLKPSFRNNIMLFYNNYISESMRSYSFNMFFNNTMNQVGNKVSYNPDTGGSISEKVNINGNWSARAFFSFNTPLKNRKYTISTNTNASYENSVSYLNVGRQSGVDAPLNTTRKLGLTERLNAGYRSDLFDITLNGSVTYGLVRNNKQQEGNRETFDYLLGGSTNINLPWQLYLSTDINYRIKNGYGEDFDQNEILWNAQLSKNFLKNNRGTIRFKIYDILQQQTNLSRTIRDASMTDTEYNTLGSYCMVHFVYRLNTLGGRAARQTGGNRERGGMPPGGFDGGGRRMGPPSGGGGGFR